jgi:hypothetical protein
MRSVEHPKNVQRGMAVLIFRGSAMDKSTAASIIKAVRTLDGLLNEIDLRLRQIPDEGERRPLLQALARMILELDIGLVRPLARSYPDLDPDK